MKSFIKLYGPPILEAIKALEKIAVDTPEVCIMNTIIEHSGLMFDAAMSESYFTSSFGEVSRERCSTIISRSGESVGEHDFYFEWFIDPTMEQLNKLIEKIDDSLAPLGCRYTITTKR